MKTRLTKLISLFLLLLIILPVQSFAAPLYYGDINFNSVVESADARIILRYSVGLENLDDNQLKIADTNQDNIVNAADARAALRMSVGLDSYIEYSQYENNNSSFEIHFIDVGQADCSLILCDGKSLLIDGGNTSDSNLIIEYLTNIGINELDYVICTHAHEDHVGGLSTILDNFTVIETIFAPATGAKTECYKNFLTSSEKQGHTINTPEVNSIIFLGSSTITFIAPITENYDDINDTSIVVKVIYGETSFLFMGDAERDSEQDILSADTDISANVLKVGHHGSENSTTYPFLREIMPEIAVISVGTNNSYGHPTEAALSRLRDANVTVYRTDIQGHIIITSDGKNLTVTTEKNKDAITNPTLPSTPNIPNSPSEPTPEIPEITGEYIGNINSKKLHIPSCSTLPKKENRIYFATIEAAINLGYSACSRCKPF